MKKTPFRLYTEFMALTMHFNSKNSYDFTKYAGRMNLSSDNFEKKSYKFIFETLHKYFVFHNIDSMKFFVINCYFKKKMFDLIHDDCLKNYFKFRGYLESMSYSFKKDFEKLRGIGAFRIEGNSLPKICDIVMRKEIYPVTFVIINKLFNLGEELTKIDNHDLLWEEEYFRLKQLEDFIIIPDIVREKIKMEFV